MSGYEADLKSVISRSREQGWRHQLTEKNHHQFYAPDGKSIVTVSAIETNQRSWFNFLADMKRHGYSDGIATLGDFMPAAKPPNGGGKLSASQYIIDLLARHPNGLPAADISAYVHSQRPDLSATVTSSTLSTLKGKGKWERTPGRLYKLAGEVITGPAKRPEISINGIEKLINPEPPPQVTEAAMDEDLKLLDSALDALAQIEGVVKRNREVLRQVGALRRMLGVK